MDTTGRVLIIMDRQLVAQTVRLTLDHGLFVARMSYDFEDAQNLIAEWSPHLVVVNMDIGDENYLERLRLRDSGQQSGVPVIALTRRGDLKTKLAAFEQGADDVLSEPFTPEELLARVMAVMRRSYQRQPQLQPTIPMGDMEIDIVNRRLKTGLGETELTSLEQSLLYFLAANPGVTLTYVDILDGVWGDDFLGDDELVDRAIASLHVKLHDDVEHPRVIARVAGIGYRFIAKLSDTPETDHP